jgi:hypothetical protein
MIYGQVEEEEFEDMSLIVDTNRYDGHHSKFEMFLRPSVKKLVKSKFVTGQS